MPGCYRFVPVAGEVYTNVMERWDEPFDINKYVKGGSTFRSTSTNGVAVSVIMNRPKKVPMTLSVMPTTPQPIDKWKFLAGFDPGRRNTLGEEHE